MHAKSKGRGVLTFASLAALLIPVAVLFFATAGGWERLGQWAATPTFIGISICAGLLIAAMVLWKGVAAAPEVVLIPAGAFLFCQSAGVFRYDGPSEQTKTGQQTLSITGYEGIEVRCNGLLLGKTPLTMTLDEFSTRVSPIQVPPVQEAAFAWDTTSSTDSLASMNWSAVPFDPSSPETGDIGTTTDVILKRFSTGQYFWEFRIGEFVAATDRIHSYKNNDDIVLNVIGWETVRRHVEALRTLAQEESVDPLVAYASHIDSHPPLRQELTPPVPQNRTPNFIHRHELERFSKEPLAFEDAVIRRDWRWIARSNEPRSVPLLKMYLERKRRQFGDDRSLLTFQGHALSILMESEQPEIQQLVRKIMTSADWTHSDLLGYYIERQLEAGANREELTSWLAGRRRDLTNHFLPLLIRVAGSNFSEVAGPYSDFEWSAYMQSAPEVPEIVSDWLAKQWRAAPSGELAMGIARVPKHQVLYAALSETDLSTTTRVRDFIQIINSSSRSEWMKEALSEAAAKALATASDQAHVTELARFLAYVPTDIGLAALEKYAGPENRVVAECEQQVRTTLKSQKESLESKLQLARDLLAGTKSSRDLVHTIRFEWKDGTYVRTQP
ncbi:MAG: hypothetical protein U0996_20945 [Planctomycetaceae bacterium]